MENVEYIFYLSSAQEDRLRVKFYKHGNEILQFCVQYEAHIRSTWQPIVRYDTSHGFAHRDLLHFDGSSDKQPLPVVSYNVALTYATNDLKQNWQRYRRLFEEEIND